jgi:hypothetical protein
LVAPLALKAATNEPSRRRTITASASDQSRLYSNVGNSSLFHPERLI